VVPRVVRGGRVGHRVAPAVGRVPPVGVGSVLRRGRRPDRVRASPGAAGRQGVRAGRRRGSPAHRGSRSRGRPGRVPGPRVRARVPVGDLRARGRVRAHLDRGRTHAAGPPVRGRAQGPRPRVRARVPVRGRRGRHRVPDRGPDLPPRPVSLAPARRRRAPAPPPGPGAGRGVTRGPHRDAVRRTLRAGRPPGPRARLVRGPAPRDRVDDPVDQEGTVPAGDPAVLRIVPHDGTRVHGIRSRVGLSQPRCGGTLGWWTP
jgi:hypothetical protein